LGEFSKVLDDLKNILASLDVNQLQALQASISGAINAKLLLTNAAGNINTSLCSSVIAPPDHDHSSSVKVQEYVAYKENFIDSDQKELLSGEIASLHFTKKTPSNQVQNRFISQHNEPYIWSSKTGSVVINNALAMENFPVIRGILQQLNASLGIDMNSVLCSYYRNGQVGVRLHNDDEDSLDPSQPICVLSIGAERKVEFQDNSQEAFRAPALKLSTEDCSLYIMKPGCQKLFGHRVRVDKKVHGERISLSFRCSVSKAGLPAANSSMVSNIALSAPLSLAPAHVLASIQECSPIKQHGVTSSARPWDDLSDTAMLNQSSNSNRMCLLFGTSITSRVDASLLSKGSRSVVNNSTSGARIGDIANEVRAFHEENLSSVSKVDKIIFFLGTNEIKWFNCDRYSVSKCFRSMLVELVKLAKFLFPFAQIMFHCVLPIRVVYNYTARSIEQFNELLYNVCRDYGCMYIDDCFDDFLREYYCNGKFYRDHRGNRVWGKEHGGSWYTDRNKDLYWDNFHLNDEGLKVVCRALKFIIFRNVFNPLMDRRPHRHY
jgi:lysophospholipase L1-like esterase/alkylated DNA repair dioxygenase AlkB